MKIRTVFLLQACLFTSIFLFIAKKILNPPTKDHGTQENPPQPRRHSVNLQDATYSYHLEFPWFLFEYPHLQNYSCSVLLSPQSEMTQDPPEPLLLLAVKSHPRSTSRRFALRQTWAREGVTEGYRVRPIFLMAQVDSVGYMNIVKKESEEYNDVLQWDFMEDHHNLSLKERCFLEWLHFKMPHVAYVFKGDDDEFVNPAALVRYIKEYGTAHSLHGAVQRHAVVLRHSKYRVSNFLFPNSKYPYFLSGGGFLLPGAAVPLLYQASQEIPVFPLDDVYLGFLILASNLTLRNEKRFYVWGLRFDACHFQQALVVHRIDTENLTKMWREVQEAKCEPTNVPIK